MTGYWYELYRRQGSGWVLWYTTPDRAEAIADYLEGKGNVKLVPRR